MKRTPRRSKVLLPWMIPAAIAFAALLHAQQSPAPAPADSGGPFTPLAGRLAEGTAEGKAALSPSSLEPAQIGTYTLKFTAGPGGIAAGGGLMIDFGKAWFTNPQPLFKNLQEADPAAPHHVSAKTSRAEAKLSLAIDRVNFDGKTERFRRMMTIKIAGAALAEGDTVELAFANTTAPFLVGRDEVRVAVDAAGDGKYRLIRRGADYEVLSGAGVEITFIGPSQAVIGKPVELQLTALDSFFNPAETFAGPVQITGLGEKPMMADFDSLSNGRVLFNWTPEKEGFVWPIARAQIMISKFGEFRPQTFVAAGNPIRVFAAEPANKIFWGDLHSHSDISKDGIGKADFEYARDYSRLDFFASTEHNENDASPAGDSITPEEWRRIKERVRDFYAPGRFATLLAYECSLGAPAGHHNVFFRSLEGAPWPSHRLKTLDALFAKLQEGSAIAIPHHLGISWGAKPSTAPPGPELQRVEAATASSGGGPAVDWRLPHNPRLRPSLEIYSGHGQSEFFDPADPLSYEQVKFSVSRSLEGEHYARDGWTSGHSLGVVSGSDGHRGQPGQRHFGITAAMAPELTREAVFDAIAARRTYATTGERIYLEFEAAGAPMGQHASAVNDAKGRVTVAAPAEIKFVEAVATAYSGGYFPIARWEEPGKLLESEFDIEVPILGLMLYVRVELKEPVRGRVARAWSSPIWIEP